MAFIIILDFPLWFEFSSRAETFRCHAFTYRGGAWPIACKGAKNSENISSSDFPKVVGGATNYETHQTHYAVRAHVRSINFIIYGLNFIIFWLDFIIF